jgi:hypothetical protein
VARNGRDLPVVPSDGVRGDSFGGSRRTRPSGRGVRLGSRDGAPHAAAEGDRAREVPEVRRAGAAGERDRDRLDVGVRPASRPAARQQRERDDDEDAGGAGRRRDREAHLWRVQVERAPAAAGP